MGDVAACTLELGGLGLPIHLDQLLVPLMVRTVDGMSTGRALCPPPLLVTDIPVFQVFFGALSEGTRER